MRIIKKYPNRRLYDTELKVYITLKEIQKYIIHFIPFKIIDAKTEKDITRMHLVQIILELEEKDNPLFSKISLEHMIRFYGDPLQQQLVNYLEQIISYMVVQQKSYQELFEKSHKPEEYLSSLAEITGKNLNCWNEFLTKIKQDSK